MLCLVYFLSPWQTPEESLKIQSHVETYTIVNIQTFLYLQRGHAAGPHIALQGF